MAAGTNVGALWWSTSIDFTGFNNSVKGAADNLSPLEKKFNNITAAAEAYLSLQFASRIAKEIINVRGEFQQLGIAFEVMLGSKTRADQLMSEAVAFAQKTPFTLTDVASNIKQLMAMGIATEDVMSTMKALGDVAAGVSIPISRVAINYGQVAALGKLQGRELRDFSMAGIPLMEELAKNLGKSKIEIDGMVSASKIGFKDVEKAFQTMAGEGGKFYNLMERTNSSVTGQVSNLTDKYQVMLNEIGKANEGVIYGGIAGLATLIENYESILDVLKVLVVTYGAYKTALIATAAAQGLMQLVENIRLIGMFRKELGLLTAAQQAFNTTAKANPYGLILAGVTALITAFTVFSDKADEVADAQQRISESINDQKVKIDRLVSTINNINAAQADRLKAEKDLNDLMPKGTIHLDSRTLSTEKGRLAINDYIKSVRNQMDIEQLESNLRQNLNEQDRIASEKFTVLQGQLYGITREDFEKRKSKEIFLLKEEAEAYAKRRDEIISGGKASNESAKTELTNAQKIEQARKNIADAEARLVELRKPGAKTSTADIQAEVDLIEEQKTLLETLTGEKQKQTKETDKLKQAQENLDKAIESGNEKAIKSAVKILDDLQKRKDLLDGIAESEMAIARNRELPRKGETTVTGAIDEMKKATGLDFSEKTARKYIKDVSKLEGENLDNVERKQKRNAERQAKYDKDQEDAEQRKREIQDHLVDGAYQFSQELIRQLDLTEEQAKQMSQLVDIAANLASGNYIGAGVSALMQTFQGTNYSDLFLKAYEKQLEAINKLLKDNQRVLDQSRRSGGESEAYKERLEILKKQQEINTERVKVAEHALRVAKSDQKSLFGAIFGGTKDERRALEAVQNELKQTQQDIEDTQQALDDLLRGGITETTIAESIAQGFEEGKTSVKDFATFVNDMLFDAVLSVFKAEILGPEITALSEYIKTALLDNNLSQEEVNQVNKKSQEIIDKNKGLWENLTSALKNPNAPESATAKSGLVGAIAGASEETMSMVAGQLMAIRVDIKTQLDTGLNHTELMMTANESLRKIELNTRNNAALPDILIELKAMNTELKKGL